MFWGSLLLHVNIYGFYNNYSAIPYSFWWTLRLFMLRLLTCRLLLRIVPLFNSNGHSIIFSLPTSPLIKQLSPRKLYQFFKYIWNHLQTLALKRKPLAIFLWSLEFKYLQNWIKIETSLKKKKRNVFYCGTLRLYQLLQTGY